MALMYCESLVPKSLACPCIAMDIPKIWVRMLTMLDCQEIGRGVMLGNVGALRHIALTAAMSYLDI